MRTTRADAYGQVPGLQAGGEADEQLGWAAAHIEHTIAGYERDEPEQDVGFRSAERTPEGVIAMGDARDLVTIHA